jgi:rfaE bifunctional protein kinase chain/domain
MDLTKGVSKRESILNALDSFSSKKILVLGDLMLDKYLYGDVSRISPEAPVQVVKFTKEANVPGGAANASYNMSLLGAKIFISGIIGEDANGSILLDQLKKSQIDTEGVIIDKKRCTTIKQRIIGGNNQQLLRIDYEETSKLSEENIRTIIDFVKVKIKEVDALVISDYGKGLVSKELIGEAINLANENKVPIIVDGKPKNLDCFVNATLITPNLKEAKEMANIDEDNIELIGNKIMTKLNSNVFITRGAEGITLFEKNGKMTHFPAKKVKVFDVTGAGDVVVAVSALGMVSELDLYDTAELANIAGRIVVQKPGTSSITLQEIKESILASEVNSVRQKVDKAWGSEDWIVNYERSNFCGKRLLLKKGHQCSIHFHLEKNEVFYINKGLVLIQAYNQEKLLKPGDSLLIEPGTKHRYIGLTDAEIIEFSSHHKEDDSYRDEPSGRVQEELFNEYLKKYSEEIKASINQDG